MAHAYTPHVCSVRIEKSKRRVWSTTRKLYVTCPNEWRDLIEPGALFSILAHERAGRMGECLVIKPDVTKPH